MIQRPHLLISDDDRDFRETLEIALTAKGFQTSLAADGQQALQLIQSHDIHLALLDYHMPHLTGLEVIQQLREAGSRLPCILISGGLTDEIVTSAERAAMVTVMQKPISVRDVYLAVHQTVRQHYDWMAG